MKSTTQEIIEMLHRSSVVGEEALDEARRLTSRSLGTSRPRQIVTYQGYSDPEAVHLVGRVLSNRPRGGPLDDDGWWENLVNTIHRWESDEVAGQQVTVTYQNHQQTVVTDEEGYYVVRFPAGLPAPDGILWHTGTARTGNGEQEIRAVHDIMVPPANASYGIISDLDDTVIHTGITSILLATKLTFLHNAKTRKPLDGVAMLYQALQTGGREKPLNPIFYISSSPWNLHDLLIDFLRLNEIPPGPLLLRDLGLDRSKFIQEKGHGHKQEKALSLLDAYPTLPFVLIGDSGQEDPRIYSELTRLRPGRVKAIYIRDVDPDADSPRNRAARQAVDIATAAGVPMILARDSLGISEHARQIGLIRAGALEGVAAEVTADQGRPETGEQALRDGLESVLKT